MTPPPTRRHLLGASLGLCAAALLPGCGQPPASRSHRTAAEPAEAPGSVTPGRPRLRLIGEATLPHRMDFQGTTVGGLSGIDYDPATGLYVLISDDRSIISPARAYTARLPLSAAGLGTPQLEHVTLLRNAQGTPFPNRQQALPSDEVPDPEAIRWLDGGHVLWASEGWALRGMGPALHESRMPDGQWVRSLPLPPMFTPRPGAGTGPRDNLAFEGLALSPDRRTAWVAMENALLQDGPSPRVGAEGGPCRITAFDLASGQAVRQIAYVPDAIPARGPLPGLLPPVLYADNGISEILMHDAHHMLVLERAYVLGQGLSLRLYRIDTRSASDTLGLERLLPGNHHSATKTLVADFATLGLSRLDNTEGMTWGPVLQHGNRSSRTLVVVSDDNFRSAQVTQFAAFEFIETRSAVMDEKTRFYVPDSVKHPTIDTSVNHDNR